MEKEEKDNKEELHKNIPRENPEEGRSGGKSGQEMDPETVRILLDDRISTGG